MSKDHICSNPVRGCPHEEVKDASTGFSGLDDLLAVASKHYAEMSPHIRKRKTAELLFLLIEQNFKLQEALVYVAHSSHKTPLNMLPAGVMLGGSNTVEVKLNAGVTVIAKYGS